jgi:hypothetical protein
LRTTRSPNWATAPRLQQNFIVANELLATTP